MSEPLDASGLPAAGPLLPAWVAAASQFILRLERSLRRSSPAPA